MELPSGQGLGLSRFWGHLGWVLLTSLVGSFAAANHHGGQQALLKLTSFTHWSDSPSLGAGMEGASGWGWRQNLPKNRQQRGEPQTTPPWQPQKAAQPWGLGKLWQT